METGQKVKAGAPQIRHVAGNPTIRRQIQRKVIALISLLIAVTSLACPPAAAGVDIQSQISECEACHGPGGASVEDDVPSLAGMDAGALLKAMEEFEYYERHCTTTTYRSGDRPKTPLNMCNVANTLSDQQRKQLADYFEAR